MHMHVFYTDIQKNPLEKAPPQSFKCKGKGEATLTNVSCVSEFLDALE